MNCTDARAVWGHKGGFIAGLRQTYPGALERIEEVVQGLVGGAENAFCTAVQEQVGTISVPYFLTHAEDGDRVATWVHDVVGDLAGRAKLEEHFSTLHGRAICLGNVCCRSCCVSFTPIPPDEIVRIQLAAVATEPDGSRVPLG